MTNMENKGARNQAATAARNLGHGRRQDVGINLLTQPKPSCPADPCSHCNDR